MHLPTLAKDFWCLVSGEERHRASPETFEIPTLSERNSLSPGQGVKLIFEIEAEEEDGTISTSTERMWVIVASCVEDGYIGILESEPCSIPNDGQFYLCRGAEIPFLPEHVVALSTPPPEYAAERLAAKPSRHWMQHDI